MRRAGLVLALLLVVLVDAVVLAGVAWNRRGAAESSLVLTERELPIGYTEKENTGLWLHLEITGGRSGWFAGGDPSAESPAWSRPERLAELGFDCSVPVTDPSAEIFYSKALPLERYAVLEYEGEAWRRWLSGKEREIEDLVREVERGEAKPEAIEHARERLETARLLESRLFLIDVGRDAADLRRQYPDGGRYIVAGAIVELVRRRPWDPRTRSLGDPVLQAFATELLVDEIHVPHQMRKPLEAIRREDQARREAIRESGASSPAPSSPRYEVTLEYGRRHEPWIAGVRLLDVPAADTPRRE